MRSLKSYIFQSSKLKVKFFSFFCDLFGMSLELFSHVTVVRSKVSGRTLSFSMMVDGKAVNTGKFKMESLEGPGHVHVNVHDAVELLRQKPKLEIGVLVDGKQSLKLEPIYLVMCVSITFGCRVCDGVTTIFVNGLDAKKEDLLLRIRFMEKKRWKKYARRDNVTELVRFIGEAVLQEEKTELNSDNKTSEAVAATAHDCLIKLNGPIPELSDDVGNNTSSTYSDTSLSDSSYVLVEDIDEWQSSPPALTLTYEKPSVVEGLGAVAVIPSSGINTRMVQQMSNALIGHFLNQTNDETSIHECLTEKLREFGEYQISLMNNGFFAVLFSSDDDTFKLLEHGQLFINESPVILKRWTQHLIMEPSQFIGSYPVWVKLYNLNLAYWSSDSLSVICSMIGIPLFVDKRTASIIDNPRSIFNDPSTSGRCRDLFARVCVEVDAYRILLPDVLQASVKDKVINVRVEYEWKPPRCTHCFSIHHGSTPCNMQRQDEPEIIEEVELPELERGKTWPSPDSSATGGIPGLIAEDDDSSVGENSDCESKVLSVPESLKEALQDDVQILVTNAPEVGSTRLSRFFNLISQVLASRRTQHFGRGISL